MTMTTQYEISWRKFGFKYFVNFVGVHPGAGTRQEFYLIIELGAWKWRSSRNIQIYLHTHTVHSSMPKFEEPVLDTPISGLDFMADRARRGGNPTAHSSWLVMSF